MLKVFKLNTGEEGFYNITSYVRQAVNESGVQEGIAVPKCFSLFHKASFTMYFVLIYVVFCCFILILFIKSTYRMMKSF